ncbi:uncharacterized protein LOC110699597 isoform X1 [Chenopodium quinoa]|uniref:uncharacterized protein LOC110699597 isoform X1 n=1 Tax=Chenopodium quinoa TaxID=63459 RepID=UPI000B798D60|nr:uncharacterized protein LOC110699597 isoform X1 [Chenopodium quinoa]XP_021732791.1 uncharacterized protein LOC110699597 isoform X1 [Chenopodium quinoa]
MAAAASIGGRSTLFRTICKKNNPFSIPSSSPRFSINSSPPIFLRRTPISPSPFPSSFRVRRELCSLIPAYSAIASACLVSRLPDGLDSSAEYLPTMSVPSRSRLVNWVLPSASKGALSFLLF